MAFDSKSLQNTELQVVLLLGLGHPINVTNGISRFCLF